MQTNGYSRQGDYANETSMYGPRVVPANHMPTSQYIQQLPADYVFQQQDLGQGPQTLVAPHFMLQNASVPNANTFRLHQNDVSGVFVGSYDYVHFRLTRHIL